MAHFAKVGADNIVIEVQTVDNWNCVDANGNESEAAGRAWQESVFGVQEGIRWIQTSYNHNIRKNYAGIGMTYDEGRDAFIHPKPYPSWTLNESTCRWEAPTPEPSRTSPNQFFVWNEETLAWDSYLGES
jgi:hypothetical protein